MAFILTDDVQQEAEVRKLDKARLQSLLNRVRVYLLKRSISMKELGISLRVVKVNGWTT